MTQSWNYSEMGAETAMPVWLLDFQTRSGDTHWRYTTAPFDVTYYDVTYSHEPGLKLGDHEVTEHEQRAMLDVTFDLSNALIGELISAPPDEPIKLVERKGHVDSSWDYQVLGRGTFGDGIFGGHDWKRTWWGWVLGYEVTDARKAILRCTPFWSDLNMAGSCLRTGRNCQVALGSDACGVDLTAYEAPGTILTVDGTTVTAAVLGGQADGYYTGGKLVTSTHSRMIVSHAGTTAILSHAIAGLAAGTAITVSPGCDHVYDSDCKTRFSNGLNFRGQPFRTLVNPHERGLL